MGRATSAALALLGLGACEPTGPYACTASVEPGIVVYISDARSGAPRAQFATGIVREGAFSDSLRPHSYDGLGEEGMRSRQAAYERAGRYSVEVRHAGYQTWVRTDVRVREGGCHVQTVTLAARLQPAP